MLRVLSDDNEVWRLACERSLQHELLVEGAPITCLVIRSGSRTELFINFRTRNHEKNGLLYVECCEPNLEEELKIQLLIERFSRNQITPERIEAPAKRRHLLRALSSYPRG